MATTTHGRDDMRTIVDDFLDGLVNYARDFAEERINEALPPQPKQPRARRVGKAPKVKKPKAERATKPAPRQRTTPTLYEVLGVDAKAEPEVIEAAWKAKARLYHPDRNKSAMVVERMKVINAAHDLLSDPTKRREYDANLKREAR